MMKQVLMAISSALVSCMVMTSCIDDDKEPVNKASYGYKPVFNSVTDLTTGETFYTPDITYQLVLDYTHSTLSMSNSNLQLTSTSSPGSIEINGLSYRLNSDGALFVSAPLASNVISSPSTYKVSDVNVTLLDRFIDGVAYEPLIHIDYTIDDRYLVTVTPQTLYYYGTLTSTNLTTGDEFTQENVRAIVTLEPRKGTANLDLKGIKFVQAMPRTLDMTFPGINFKTNTVGFTLDSDNLIPTISNDPFPAYPISDLSSKANLSTGVMPLEFDCHPAGMDKYHITIEFGPTQTNND